MDDLAPEVVKVIPIVQKKEQKPLPLRRRKSSVRRAESTTSQASMNIAKINQSSASPRNSRANIYKRPKTEKVRLKK